MGFVQNAVRNIGTAGELLSFFSMKKRWWILPMVIALFLVGVLIVAAQSSAIAPFIYTLF
jgi:hypothetical protein